jgi:hypothetical protein
VTFTILTRPGSDPGAAHARGWTVVDVDGSHDVVAAAQASCDDFIVLLGAGARPAPNAFGGLTAALGPRTGVLGGATLAGATRHFGWMLAPPCGGPLPFELVPIAAPAGTAGIDASVRGAVDVVAPGMLVVARALLLQALPAEPVAALVELCARARDAGLEVNCRSSFACEAPLPDADDRGRCAALRAVAEARPQLRGLHRLPSGLRYTAIERRQRAVGGYRSRTRIPMPNITILVHGAGAAAAAARARTLAAPVARAYATQAPADALRAELRVRGDRYVLVADASHLPDAAGLQTLVEALESEPFVALVAPDRRALDGSCVLLAPGRFPQHVQAGGASLAAALGSLTAAADTLRRAVSAAGYVRTAPVPRAAPPATIVFLAASLPEITRLTLDATIAAAHASDELVAVCAANADTARRALAMYPQLRVELDPADPLLVDAANRALSAARHELVALVADDVLLPGAALDRLRAAFARIPTLGAAFPAVAGAATGEGAFDLNYADIAELREVAARRERERARECEPIDIAAAPAFVVSRAALDAVGGIDPALGPTGLGIADLATRLRAAGYGVVRCDDALAHRFDPAVSRNPAAAASAQQPAPVADAAAISGGFDPARRVAFARGTPAAAAAPPSHVVAVPVADAAELERAASFLAAAARAFDVNSPVRVDVLLDGAVAPAEVAARLRTILAATGKPMEATLAVRVERSADLAVWRRSTQDAGLRAVLAAGHERAALAGLACVKAAVLSELLEAVA